MCGIAGLVSFKGSVERGLVKKMTDTIAHRGPDGEGCWISQDGSTGLGHRRLSIIDLTSAAAQPMSDDTGRFVITFNGEIYNYLELRDELKRLGYHFRTESDTEVLIALYQEYGERCVERIDGMFAFAVRDNHKRLLFLARDRFGEKPLYYFQDSCSFVFASEMKAIFAAGIRKDYDPKRLHYYLSFNLYQDPNDAGSTFYKDIRQLEPGHTMQVHADGCVEQRKYWEVDAEKQIQISETEAREKFDFLLRRSITRRLRSDVPVGSSLSGGLDSSTIVLLINKMKLPGQNQKTFSARFENFDRDEGKYIDLVLSSAGNIQGFSTWPDAGAMEELDRIWFHQEEPFGSASIVAQWAVMKLARDNNVTVLLDGQGADEILGGYKTFFTPLLNRLYACGDKHFERERSALEVSGNYKYIAGTSTRMMLRYPRLFSKLSAAKKLFVKPPVKTINQSRYSSDFAQKVKEWTHPLEGIYNDDVKRLQKRIIEQSGFSPLLRYADRNSMAFSRELRLPFLEHELVEFCISLPDQFKVSNGWTKRLLRETYAGLLPQEICWRKDKVGFEAPQSVWINAPEVKAVIDAAGNELVRSGIVKEGQKFDPWHTLMAAKLIGK